MKTLLEFTKLTANQRANGLKTLVVKQATAKKEIAKILVAAEECGDFGKGKGEMNTYAVKITGVELRREAQGIYEYCNVMRAIRAKSISMTEAEFDSAKFGSFPLIMLSGFMGKSPEKVSEALEIIRSGLDVTKRLQALRGPSKKSAPEDPPVKVTGEKGESDTDSAPSEIQTPAAAGDTFFFPHADPVLNHPEFLSRLIGELKGAGTIADCDAYLVFFKDMAAHVESRFEALEAEAAQPAALAA